MEENKAFAEQLCRQEPSLYRIEQWLQTGAATTLSEIADPANIAADILEQI